MIINKVFEKYFNDAILLESCKRFGIEKSAAKLIRANNNLIFDCGDKILRISHSEIRNFDDIKVEIHWLNFLRNKGLSIVKVINSNESIAIEKIGLEDHFSIVCFEKIMGSQIEASDWNELHFEKLGDFVGKLHKFGQQYTEQEELDYKHWNEIDEYGSFIYLSKANFKIHNKLVAEFNSYSKPKESYGLIHYDFHRGNYLMTGKEKKIVLFDFEMVCKSWYANDVAAVVYYAKHFATVREEENFETRFLNSFWKGYEKEYKIDNLEKEKIPKFLLYRDLLLLGFVSKLWGSKILDRGQVALKDRIEKSIAKRSSSLRL